MKSPLLFLLITATVLPLCSYNLYAQNQPAPKMAELQHKNYFITLAQIRLTDMLSKAQVQQQNQSLELKRLSAKNDSLLALGNMYDTVATDVSKRVLDMQQSFDSISNAINNFQQQINNKNNFRKHYLEMEPGIKATVNLVDINSLKNISTFRSMNLQLDTSNLAGEKARLKGILNSAAKQQEKEAVVLVKLDNSKDSQLSSGNVDSAIAGKLDERLQIYQHRMDSLAAEIATLQQKVNSPKEFSKDFIVIKTKILLIDSVVNKKAVAREYIFNMIEDGLSKSKPNLFSLAAFFGPGGFIIPDSKYNIAKKYFSPIIDSLVKFSNNYATVFRTATVTVNGYADGSNIGKGSKLYNTLADYLKKSNPEKEELNGALSALRAEKISLLLTQLLKERFPDFKLISKIVFESNEAGMGEKLPDSKINNYKSNDERRRIVVIFWNVIPEE
jgi:hypothetical protein